MSEKLKEYNGKRNFSRTGEPAGRVKTSGERLRFSVQHHIARADHYDLRLEYGGVAWSWAIPKGPSFSTKDKRLAMRVEDHPIDYMQFEGTIPKGEYGGGTVMLWDEGEWIPRTDPKRGLIEGSLKFFLNGERLKGNWALVRMKQEDDAWLFIKERDEFAKKSAGIGRFTTGVRSGKRMKEIQKASTANPFQRADVMLAQLTERLPSDMGWVYELKYDGHRTLGFVEGGKTRLLTRNGHDSTATFPAAAKALGEMMKDRAAVVDGEMVVIDRDGVSDFSALQSYAKRGEGGTLGYVLFDLLALDGKDLRDSPLLERKELLQTLLTGAPPLLSYSKHTRECPTESQLAALKARGIEGIVAKRSDSRYVAGKNGDWVKLKLRNSREFVVGGFTRTDTGQVKALLVGFFRGKELIFAGSVGTGFSEQVRRDLTNRLNALCTDRSPFGAVPKKYRKEAVWVKPAVAVQTEYAEMTASNLLRQASFKGFRDDKAVHEIKDEYTMSESKPSKSTEPKRSASVILTSPDKVMFPAVGLTKKQLFDYYAAVADRMLPYLKDRVLSLVCCPSGVEGEKFFRRHLEGQFAGLGFVPAEDKGDYFYVKNADGILSLVQYNAVEFHMRGSKKGTERPDVMVFDLDPDEGLAGKEVRRGARDVREVLEALGLRSFLKTSGGKGYHVVVPLRTGADGELVRDFSKKVVELLENKFPARYTSRMAKQAREGKIFIDWQRNSRNSTSAAPYSVRARERATVSMPIAWEELSRVAPDGVTVAGALKRLARPDPWADFFEVKKSQTLKK